MRNSARIRLRIEYNAPFVLTFSLACFVVYLFDVITSGRLTLILFSVTPHLTFTNPVTYLRIFLHTLGHSGAQHLILNLSLILLIGPLLEEKYGSLALLQFSLVTAAITGVLNILLFSHGLLGASGIAFMLILLSSFTNVRSGSLPLTFILVMILYLGNEIYGAFKEDNISQFAHILGGLSGGAFGFMMSRKRR